MVKMTVNSTLYAKIYIMKLDILLFIREGLQLWSLLYSNSL